MQLPIGRFVDPKVTAVYLNFYREQLLVRRPRFVDQRIARRPHSPVLQNFLQRRLEVRQLACGIAAGVEIWSLRAITISVSAIGKESVGAWKPHVMIYYPYWTSEAAGSGVALSDAGRPTANLTIQR